MSRKVIWCDPPSGWKFGFPKPVPENVLSGGKFEEWLTSEGYPDKLRESLGENFPCRFWEEDKSDETI